MTYTDVNASKKQESLDKEEQTRWRDSFKH